MARQPQSSPEPQSAPDSDPQKLISDLRDVVSRFKLPGIDVDSLVATYRKNFEAATQANRIAFEGFQTLARKQAEVFRESLTHTQHALTELAQSKSPTDLATKQAELFKEAFERSMTTMRELSEILVKVSQEASQKINDRVAATLDEIRSLKPKS